MSVISIIRHAITRFIAIARLSRSAVFMRQGFNTTSRISAHDANLLCASAGNTTLCNPTHHPLIVCQLSSAKTILPPAHGRGILFLNVNNPKRYRRHFLKIGRRLQLCPYISNGYFGNTGCALTPCFLTFLFDSGALSGNLYGYRDCIGDCMTSSNSLFSPMVLRLCCARMSKSTRELLRRWSSKISKNPPPDPLH